MPISQTHNPRSYFYSVCVFAYGQTGSGKTYTMEGPDNYDDESMGMISRSVKQIFDTAAKMATQGYGFHFLGGEGDGRVIDVAYLRTHDRNGM